MADGRFCRDPFHSTTSAAATPASAYQSSKSTMKDSMRLDGRTALPAGLSAPSPAAGLAALQSARFGPLGASGLPAAQPRGLHRRMAVARDMVVGGWRLPYLPHLRAQATSQAVGAHLGSGKGDGGDDEDREDGIWDLLHRFMSSLFSETGPTQIGMQAHAGADGAAPEVHRLREMEAVQRRTVRLLSLQHISVTTDLLDEYKAVAQLEQQPRSVAAGPGGSAGGGCTRGAQETASGVHGRVREAQGEQCGAGIGGSGEYTAAKRVALLMLAHLRLEQAIRCEELVVPEADEDDRRPGPSGWGDIGQGEEAGAHQAGGAAPGRALRALRCQHRHRVAACVCCDALLRHLRLPVLLLPELDLVAGMAAEAQAQLRGRWPPIRAPETSSGHGLTDGLDALLRALLGGCGCGCSSGGGGAAPSGAATRTSPPSGDRSATPACSTATRSTHTTTSSSSSSSKATGSVSATSVRRGSICTCWLYSLQSLHLLVTCMAMGAPQQEGSHGGGGASGPSGTDPVSCMANPMQLTAQFGRVYVGAALHAERIVRQALRDDEEGPEGGAREEEGASGSVGAAGDASGSSGSGSGGSGSRRGVRGGSGGMASRQAAGRTDSNASSSDESEGDDGGGEDQDQRQGVQVDTRSALEELFREVFMELVLHRVQRLRDEYNGNLMWVARMQESAAAGGPGPGSEAMEELNAYLHYFRGVNALLGGMVSLLRQRSTEQLEQQQQQEREEQDGAGGLAAGGLPAGSAWTTTEEGQAAGAGYGGNTSCHASSPQPRSSAECSPPLSASSPSTSTPSASSPSTSPSCRAPAAPTAGASDATTGCGGDGHSPGLLLLRSASFATPPQGLEPASRGLGSMEGHDKHRPYGAEELAARMALARAWIDTEVDGVPRAVRLEGPLAAHMLLQAAAGATTAWGMVANLLALAAAEGAPAVGAGVTGAAGGTEPCCPVVMQLGAFKDADGAGACAAEAQGRSGPGPGPSGAGAPAAAGCVDVLMRPGCSGLLTELLQHLLHKMPYHTLRDKKLRKQLSASLSEHQAALVRCCGPEEAWAALKVLCELRTPLLSRGQELVVAAVEAGTEAGFLSPGAAGAAGETSPDVWTLAHQHQLQHFISQAMTDLTHLDARRCKGHGRQGRSVPFRKMLLPHWRQRWRLAANASTCALLGVLRGSRDPQDMVDYGFGGSSASCPGDSDDTEGHPVGPADQDLSPRPGASMAGMEPGSGFWSAAWVDTWIAPQEKQAVRPCMEPYDGTAEGRRAYGAEGCSACDREVVCAGLQCEALAREPRGRVPLVLVVLVAEGGKEEEGREGAGARGREGKGAAGGGGVKEGPLVLPALEARLREMASRGNEMRVRKAMGVDVRRR